MFIFGSVCYDLRVFPAVPDVPGLSNLMAQFQQFPDPPESTKKLPTLVAVAGGKGGVGKSVVAANLGVALAQRNRSQQVAAIDLDVGCGNLNWCLGVAEPKGIINHFILGEIDQLSELLNPTPQNNLKLICSSYTGVPEVMLDSAARKRILSQLSSLSASYVLLDLGAGTGDDVLYLFLGADEKLIVVNPDPLSLQNSFIFLKTTILRFLLRELSNEDFLSPVKHQLIRTVEAEENLNVRQLVSKLKQWDRYATYGLAGLVDDLRVKIIVNMYRGSKEQQSFLSRFHELLFRDLCLRNNLSYLGFIHFDPGIQKSIQGTKPYLIRFRDRAAAGDLRAVAERLETGVELDNLPTLHFPEAPTSWWQKRFG